MDERGKEFVAKKKWDTWQVALFSGVILIMLIAFAVLSMLGIMFMVAFLFVLGILSLYYMKNTFKAEYAYTISNRMIVEVLKSGGKRSDICDFFLADMTVCGKWTSDKKDGLKNEKIFVAATDVKDEDETYYAVFDRNGSRNVVLFTPDEMMLDEMARHTKCVIEK